VRNTSLFLLFAIVMLQACKSKSNVGAIGDIKNNKSNSRSWSKEYRTNFLQDCIDKASETVNASEAFKYCNCMTEKVEAKYPDETEADGKISAKEIQTLKAECLSMNSKESNQAEQTNNLIGWSVADQKEFMDGCTPTVNKTLGTTAASDYCDCLLKKLIQEYPDSKSVDRASKIHLSALASDCLGR
jgi:hypothetical protein